MSFKKHKWLFYVATLLLITIVSAALRKPDDTVPPISNAILLVGIFYTVIFLVYKLICLIFRSPKKNNEDPN